MTARAWVSIAALVFAVAAVPRLLLALLVPTQSPDGTVYLNVARNLMWHGCVSMSDAADGTCVPHWGGNHLPGYPAFLAMFGADVTVALLAQSMLVAAAVAWLAVQLGRLLGRPLHGAVAVLLVALSPAHLAWGRFVLPDALTVAVAVWIMAEIARGLHQRRLPVVSLGLAVSAACWLRYDGVIVSVAVAVAGFSIHRPAEALRRGTAIALIVAVPLVGWSLRSASQGLGWFPQPRFMLDGSFTPAGFLAWGRTWIVNLPQGAGFGYPLATKNYHQIVIGADVAYASRTERARVETLMDRLAGHRGRDFPADIDAEFASIAAKHRAEQPIEVWLSLPLRRALSFWLSPVASLGWPLELRSRLTAAELEDWNSGGLAGKLAVAWAHPFEALGKAILLAYRTALVLAAIWAAIVVLRGTTGPWRALFIAATVFALARTAALSFQISIDPRYMASAQAALEAAIGPLLVVATMRRRAETEPRVTRVT